MRKTGVAILVLAAACARIGWAESAPPRGNVTLLNASGSPWRYYEAWQTEVARTDAGALVRVDALRAREAITNAAADPAAPKYRLRPAPRVHGSALPPPDWNAPDFDDRGWMPGGASLKNSYRSLAVVYLRGKFEVKDPAAVDALSLSLAFQGGAVAYVNGREVGRASMPEGKIAPDTLAQDYPRECFVNPDGSPLPNVPNWSDLIPFYRDYPDPGHKQRRRTMEVKIPAAVLRKGVNVLALEIHRAPAMEAMFTYLPPKATYDLQFRLCNWWNRAALEDVTLAATADPAAVAANTAVPKGLQVWTLPAFHVLRGSAFGDPNDAPLIRLHGARNGAYSGQLVVGSTDSIRGLKVETSELAGENGGKIPAAAVQARYLEPTTYVANWTVGLPYDALEDAPPAVVPTNRFGNAALAVQPVYVTVRIPRDAKPGRYAGTVTVRVDGEAPRAVPLALDVFDWALPDPRDLRTYIALPQSPESVALQYHVPPWSDAHWKLLDRTFELLGQVGEKEIYLTAIRRTHYGNEQAMIRFARQEDGSYAPDFSIADKYLGLAVKHLGPAPTVVVYLHEIFGVSRIPSMAITIVDPKTGALSDAQSPDLQTPEGRAFLKTFLAGLRELLARHGVEKSLTWGMIGDSNAGINTAMVKELKDAAPEVAWAARSHWYYKTLSVGTVGRLANVHGICGVFWDPDEDKPFYGWRNPVRNIVWARDDNGDCSGVGLAPVEHMNHAALRLAAEGSMLTGRRHAGGHRGNIAGQAGDEFPGFRGFGDLGADFWPVLKGEKTSSPLSTRYPEVSWITLHIHAVMASVLAPGAAGPVSTARFEMIREGAEEAEARIFVQDALDGGKLPPDLATRCRELCDQRTRMFREFSEFYFGGFTVLAMSYDFWQEPSRQLYQAAAEAARALKTKN